ncbi:prolyl oligopeptidase family serine peptidase [Nesterenkonia sp. HG001]|uniref:S9 family peptidase n=1 Tax=Nesterenkonia sp. HG001 TaxID=2983207 RepID=UPI002AC37E7B|nr:prolyl oligopeptidase family serine peptidase [Nesterenkonia sp. HG001]MDZ5076916.1 prolyl oligopeptidase family serine peptidase [Nesterenkonia sp. HG001]
MSDATRPTTTPATLPFGEWPSSITAEQLAVGGNRVSAPSLVGDHLWWTEGLAAEAGRQAIVRSARPVRRPGVTSHGLGPVETVTVLPAPYNARSRVHEYGGASWLAIDDGRDSPLILFVNFADQRIHRFREGEAPTPLSPIGETVASAAGPSLRWAQPVHVQLPGHDDEVWWICEDHTGAKGIERYVAAVPLDGAAADDATLIRRVTPSSRFVAHPRLSPDGAHLAWVSWEHPQMPWDGTELHVGRVEAGVVVEDAVLDGDTGTSVLQPEWRDASRLIWLSDRTGWWNPWTATLGKDPRPVLTSGPAADPEVAEQEFAGPLWQLGQTWLTLLDADTALVVHGTAVDRLGVLDIPAGAVRELDLPHTMITGVRHRADGLLAFAGVSPEEFSGVHAGALVRGVGDDGTGRADGWRVEGLHTVRSSREDAPDPGLLPVPEPITVTTAAGQQVHAVLYRPRNAGAQAPEGELPPYIAQVHGGPTGQAAVGLSLGIAYYTSRGIGVVDINYGGSTGFGRAYRDRLKGQWGVVDVEDTVEVMRHLVRAGIADGERLGIEGGSAGGWTTLACLTRTEEFSAGVSSFGVADAVALAQDTHDFESRYLDGLIGRYPEEESVYVERAPLNHVDSLSCPVLLLQGDEDPIVPPNQAEMFRDALAAKGIPYAYLLFEGEQHGFRKAENIIAAQEASLSFYGQVFGFEPVGIPRLELTR